MGGGGTALACSPVSEDTDEEEADVRAKWEEQTGEGDQLTPHFLPERDLALPDERLRRLSERGDSLACSCRPVEPVAEAAPAGETTPGAGTLADEQATGPRTSPEQQDQATPRHL